MYYLMDWPAKPAQRSSESKVFPRYFLNENFRKRFERLERFVTVHDLV